MTGITISFMYRADHKNNQFYLF